MAGANARVLILGSLPGRRSLELQQYYALPQNTFWRIMDALFSISADASYASRLARLRAHRVALWDVCHSAFRRGSLDASIEPASVRPNDLASFFAAHRSVRGVFFNGAKAAALYTRLVLPTLPSRLQALPRSTLPSTSPAHAALAFPAKLARWSAVQKLAEGR